MADVLRHLQKEYLGKAPDWYDAVSVLDSTHEGLHTDLLERYRLRLVSQVGYAIPAYGDNEAREHAFRYAKERLVHHLYSEQLDLAHKAAHALHAGQSRQKVLDIVYKLLESMRE